MRFTDRWIIKLNQGPPWDPTHGLDLISSHFHLNPMPRFADDGRSMKQMIERAIIAIPRTDCQYSTTSLLSFLCQVMIFANSCRNLNMPHFHVLIDQIVVERLV